MIPLSHEECIELGLSIPSNSLKVWATVLLAAAQWKLDRLELRGITAGFLKEVKALIQKVGDLEDVLGKEKFSLPPEAARAQTLREAATAYREQAGLILKVESMSIQDGQTRPRLEGRTGPSLGDLAGEMEYIVGLLRDSSPKSAPRGIDDHFIAAGVVLIRELKETQVHLRSASQALSPALAEQCFQKGRLYERIWRLVQIGQLEFIHEPEQASAFKYSTHSLPNRTIRSSSEVLSQTGKPVVP